MASERTLNGTDHGLDVGVWNGLEALRTRFGDLPPEHHAGTRRFFHRLDAALHAGALSLPQLAVVADHVLRLGERGRNPANTGNIEDLFFYTLADTKDVLRAFAQAVADSAKVVPMDPDAPLWPFLRNTETGVFFRRVKDLDLSDGDAMLVAHTMVAFGDEEMWSSCMKLVEVTFPSFDRQAILRETSRMAVQSQHLPSSAFVMARAHGITVDCAPLYRDAGYDEDQIRVAQHFYDVGSRFSPEWATPFLEGRGPEGQAWQTWRRTYLEARTALPEALQYQLSSDTLTNFLEGTLESGKWTDASVFFGGITRVEDVPDHVASIINQYLAEHRELHDRPTDELIRASAGPLEPWGIGFVEGRARVVNRQPPRQASLEAQFRAAWQRKKETTANNDTWAGQRPTPASSPRPHEA
ncbi:MAG: hypothetical protein ACFB9M_05155 [Myxococcota bacterium]